MRIAVLDADMAGTLFICRILSGVGHTCHVLINDGELTELLRQPFDLLVIDWKMACNAGDRMQQGLPVHLPILFMVDRNDETDISSIANSDVVDFIERPISTPLLIMRVGMLLRRAWQSRLLAGEKTFGEHKFDLRLRQVSVDDRPAVLTQKEFDLASLFFKHLNRSLSRAHIRAAVWMQSEDVAMRTIDTHVSVLRLKLALRPENGYRLVPVYGYGYRLECVAEDPASGEERKFFA
ncbi:response regulator transcription factor [Paraburkholderia tropica]|uniref:response regulator transcription factor n=1 Tax=Paraburkholderia tropica TaxID=92647 RepID=UPI003D2D0903